MGSLDDLLIVPPGILLVVRMIRPDLMADFRAEAAAHDRPVSKVGLVTIIAVWVLVASWIGWAFWLYPTGD